MHQIIMNLSFNDILFIYLFIYLQDVQQDSSFVISPQSAVPKLATSDWPLLLKVCVQEQSAAVLVLLLSGSLQSCC